MLWYSIPMEVIYMSQVKVTNKKSGITYVYESESYDLGVKRYILFER